MEERPKTQEQLSGEIKILQGQLKELEKVHTQAKEAEEALFMAQGRLRTLISAIPATIYISEIVPPYRGTFISDSVKKQLGYEPAEFIKDANFWFKNIHPDDASGVATKLLQIFKSGHYAYEYRFRHKDGSYRWMYDEMNLVKDANGKPAEIVGYWVDITERKEAEEKLKEARAELEIRVKVRTAELSKTNEDLLREVSERKRIEERLSKINQCLLRFTDEPSENISLLVALFGEVTGATCAMYNALDRDNLLCSFGKWHTPKDYNPKDNPEGHICYDIISKNVDKPQLVRNLQETNYAKTDPNVRRYNLQTYLGFPIKLQSNVVGSLCAAYLTDYVPTDEDMNIGGIIATALEIEEKRRVVLQDLRSSEDLYRGVYETSPLAFVLWDKDCRITDWNKQAEKMFGWSRAEALGKIFFDLIIPESARAQVKDVVSQLLKGNLPSHSVNENLTKDKKIILCEWNNAVRRGANGEVVGAVSLATDITEHEQVVSEWEKLKRQLIESNMKLKTLSLTDSLTGLHNSHFLNRMIEAEFQRAKRYDLTIAAIMLDIDYFKSVNDVYGHDFGDLVLKQFSQQLKRLVRRVDVVTRLSGEEFVIVLPGTGRAEALVLAQRLLDEINVFNFGDAKNKVKLRASFAVVAYPEDKANKGQDLINLADKILNKTKEFGGNSIFTALDLVRDKLDLEKRAGVTNVRSMKVKIAKLTKSAHQSLAEAIFALAKTIELKDHYTGEHVESTVRYATDIARAMNLPKDETELVRKAAMLHDLGKIGVSENILLKKSKLTREEFKEIKKHPQIGADIIRPIHFLRGIIPLISYHHERWDGKGYPSGIKREEIPVGARIIAIADVYQALTSDRPYRKAFSQKKAIEILKKGAGTQFDPKIVEIFLKILKKEK